jgi:hypothetical protein
MTTERFDIEVRDAVAKSIRAELTAIGGAARSTHTLVQQLNRELAAGTRTAATSARTAAAQATSAAGASAAAQARATAESARAAAQAARTETAQRKANIAYLQEEAALNRAVAAEARAIASKQRLAAASNEAASATQRQTIIHDRTVIPASPNSTLGGQAGSRSTAARQVEIMRGGASSSIQPPTQEVRENTTALGANRAAATAAATAQGGYAARATQAGNASRLQAHHMTNLVFQLNDVFVSLISGQKPMMVMIQQGSQIGQIGMQAGMSWRQMGAEMLVAMRIIKRTTDAEAAAELAAASMAAKNLEGAYATAAANVAAADTEIALALAQREVATTASQTAAAEARLTAAHEAAAVAASEQAVAEEALAVAQGRQGAASANASRLTVTSMGRAGPAVLGFAVVAALATATLGALKSQANDDSGLRHFTRSMGYSASEVKKLNAVTVSWGDTAKAVFQVGIERLAAVFGFNTSQIASAWNSALNWMARTTRAVMAGIYAAVAGMAYGVRNIIHNIDGKSGNDNPLTNLMHGYRDAYNSAQGFFDDVVARARRNARGRQDQMAAEMVNPPHHRKAAQGWDRAKELRQANEELDAQIGLLDKYGDELERANQLEQIGRQFREHNAPLTAAENAALEAKIRTIQEGRRVQEAMTAADVAANGAERTFSATQEALNKLLERGAIDHAEYNRQLRLAQRAFEDATDPLAAMNRELEKSAGLVSHFGRDRTLREYIESLRQAADAHGDSIYQTGTTPPGASNDNDIVVTGSKRYTPEVQRMIDEFQRQQQVEKMTSAFEAIDPREQEQPGSSSYMIDHYREMYAEIQRFREEDVHNEEEANRRKQNLDRALADAKLETASGMFGQLAGLQNSHIKEVAAIGKAAAIAQATIDGYRAVQAALAGPPGPPWSFAIAGVTAVMTAANVARIAGIGFQRGGYTGDGNPNDVAGPAHRQEFVFDGAATRRIGVPALEALRSGRTFGPGQSGGRSAIGGTTSVSIGQISVRVEGKSDDPEATGAAVERGILRAVRKVARDEIKDQQRDGGLLDQRVMAH